MDYPAFVSIYKEFSSLEETKVSYHLTRAINRINSDIWGTFNDEAVGLLTAHFLSSLDSSSLGGTIKRIEIEGDIEVESESGFKVLDNYDLTPYGRQFKELKASVVGSFIGSTHLDPVPYPYG